jgi:hypothetical protein
MQQAGVTTPVQAGPRAATGAAVLRGLPRAFDEPGLTVLSRAAGTGDRHAGRPGSV